MIKDHMRLLTVLHKIENSKNAPPEDKSSLVDYFKWSIEKHFFVEEKTIFSNFLIKKDKVKVYNIFLETSKQHTKILNEINTMRIKLIKGIDIFPINIRDDLISHQKYEESIIYPRFDEELNDNEKEMIFNRITEII
jgi:hypothetical protein